MSSTKRAPWVKWYPESFLNGVMDLNFTQLAVYTFILNLIYANNGPIVDSPIKLQSMARRLGMRSDHFQRTLSELVEHGKIIRVDGVMSNPRAEKELSERASKTTKLMSNFRASENGATKNVNKFNGSRPQMGAKKSSKSAPRVEREVEVDKNPPPPKRSMKSTRIDPHRRISDQNIVFARSRGLTKREIDHEWMVFVRYYAQRDDRQSNARSMDWDATWESWVLKKAFDLNREPLVEDGANGKTDPAHLPHEFWARQIELWRKGVSWPDQLGPEPGQPGCLAPVDLVSLS